MQDPTDPEEIRVAHEALVAFGQARNSTESMRVCRDYRDALLSGSAMLIMEIQISDLQAKGDKAGADQLMRTFYQLRTNLESPEYMEMVNNVLAREHL